MRILRVSSILVCGLALFHASASKAEELAADDDGHEGLYLRLNAGVAFMNVTNSESPVTLGGTGWGFSLAAGHAITQNLVLFGEFMMNTAGEPEVSALGQTATLTGSTLSSLAFGPGVSYYLMPLNAYLTGTLLLGTYSVTKGDVVESTDSKLGLGGKVAVGKEWRLAPKFGLGLAGTASVMSLPEKDDDSKTTLSVFGLALSGTYN